MAGRSNKWVYRRPPAQIVGSNTAGGMDVFLMSVVCCKVEVSVSGWSIVQRSPTECGVWNECDRKAPLGEAITQDRVEVPQEKKSS